ncbi:MAG: HD domain-containing protein [Bacillota bacterium]|nr:HD domain-containing protein [Bacillota bacterium]
MLLKAIKEFSEGERIDGFFIIKSVECKVSSNSKKYMDFMISDKTGEIDAKLWDYVEGDEKKYCENTLIKVRGLVTLWQGSLQLKMERIRLKVDEDKVDIEDFVPSAPYKSDEMFDQILEFLSYIKNEDIKNIISAILEDNSEKLMHYPAAKKNHHSIRAGLLYHTTTMLKAGQKLSEIYSFINKDLLYGGIILHDMAKIQEMDASDLGIVSDYTIEGQLLGHIVMGVKMVEMAADAVGADKETTMLLQHMILSHHYEPEYGSPVKPMIPEAELLHYLDIIDARMYDMSKAVSETNTGSFSSKIWSLENRKVYKSHISNEEK